MTEPRSTNWKAWHDFMPGSEPTLHITGQVIVPTTGYSASLVAHQPQGVNPAIYILDLVLVPPNAGQLVEQTITTLNIHYREGTRNMYAQVTILPDHTTLDVETVS